MSPLGFVPSDFLDEQLPDRARSGDDHEAYQLRRVERALDVFRAAWEAEGLPKFRTARDVNLAIEASLPGGARPVSPRLRRACLDLVKRRDAYLRACGRGRPR